MESGPKVAHARRVLKGTIMFRPIRFLIASNKAALVGLSLTLAIGVAISLLLVSVPEEGTSTGRVTSLGLTEGKTGSRPLAVVSVDGETAQVRVPRHVECRVGQRVALVRQRSLSGPRYGVAIQPRPCFD